MVSSAHSRRVVKFATDDEDETVYHVDVDESLYPEERQADSTAQSETARALIVIISLIALCSLSLLYEVML